jgi:photosystem II stability/assembly factor-like uncharacterized protein
MNAKPFYLFLMLLVFYVHAEPVGSTILQTNAQETATSCIIIPSTGPHGTVSPPIAWVEKGGKTQFTATPHTGFIVNRWFLDGEVVQIGGATYTLSNITQNHTVKVTFADGRIFVSTANGDIYYSSNKGANWTPTTKILNTNKVGINSVFATSDALFAAMTDGNIYYSTNNGNTWTVTAKPNAIRATTDPSENEEILTVFALGTKLYASTTSGNIYYSTNLGQHWSAISKPGKGKAGAIHSLFATSKALYAGAEDGNLYFSSNQGAGWKPINGAPDGSPITNVYLAGTTLYVNTGNGYVYTCPSPTGGGHWNTYAQGVYRLFVNANASQIIASTSGGHVFSLTSGDEMGFVSNSPITSVFLFN